MQRTLFLRSSFTERFGLEISVVIAFVVKLILSLTTIGTNDSATWYGFLRYISQHDGISLYQGSPLSGLVQREVDGAKQT